jgi:hypothetical protein
VAPLARQIGPRGGGAVSARFAPLGRTDQRRDPCFGQDGDIQAGADLRYVDNGDGTITDLNTLLVWEKKSDDGSIHDQNAGHTWDNAFAVHVAGLNQALRGATRLAPSQREGTAEHRGLRDLFSRGGGGL